MWNPESLLSDWPFDMPADRIEWVNAAQTEMEIEALRRRANRGTPYGPENWKIQIAAALGLKYTLQPLGRPRKVMGLTNMQTQKMFASPLLPVGKIANITPDPEKLRGEA